MSTTKTKTEVITLNPIKMSTFTVHIEGTSDLILCKKARSFELPEIFKQSHPKGTQIPAELNQPYNLWEKLITGIHWEKPITFHDDDWSLYSGEEWEDYMKNNKPCLLGKAFQDAMKEAFISCGFKESTGKAGTDFKRTISIASIVPVSFREAGYSQHLAQTSGLSRVNVITQQNVLHDWHCDVQVNALESAFPKQTIIELFNMAGTFIGVGSRRGEGYGRFHVTEVK